MTRVVYILGLNRALPSSEHALLERFRLLYHDGDYRLDDAGCLEVPELRDPKQLSELLSHSNINSDLEGRIGRCNWLDQI